MNSVPTCVACARLGKTTYLNQREIEGCARLGIEPNCTTHATDLVKRAKLKKAAAEAQGQVSKLQQSARKGEDEVSTIEAMKMLGVSKRFLEENIIEPRIIPSRRLTNARGSFVLKKADVQALLAAVLRDDLRVPEVVRFVVRMRVQGR